MKKINISSAFDEYDSESDLTPSDRQLLKEARLSAVQAYAPYSRFQVGAAVLLENGILVKGNNQENASYPLGLCAERVALFAAGSNYPEAKIKAIAITAQSSQFSILQPITPCGACRQAISEYEHRYQHPIRIIMAGESGKILVTDSVSNLLPYQFTGDDLKSKT